MVEINFKKSKIHGFGIFATRDFKKGELVIRWKSHKQIAKENINKLSEEEKHNISYIDGEYILVPPEGRINHSCNPNVHLANFCYIAKRDIKNGEEITADYRKESEHGFEMKCNCGSKNCVGIIYKK
ncbi:MAG: SET domain-containing protein-lysine N-methyltransferase [Patescibacteria group bacterium]